MSNPPTPSHRAGLSRRRLMIGVPAAAAAVALGAEAFSANASPAKQRTAAPRAASSGKGISVTPFDGADKAIGEVGATWYYTWDATTGQTAKPAGAEFVPMIWGAKSVTDENLAAAKGSGNKVLLGFNEPDLGSQANMTVEDALGFWPKLQDTGLRLGAPAVSGSGDKAGGWLDRFMSGAADKKYRVDFIPLHWYGGDFSSAAAGQLKSYLENVHKRFNKPIWLTEYALIDFSGSQPRFPSEQQQTDFIKAAGTMLAGLDYVERHAWFTLSADGNKTGLYAPGSGPNASGTAYRDAG